jgi:hypothetical protein
MVNAVWWVADDDLVEKQKRQWINQSTNYLNHVINIICTETPRKVVIEGGRSWFNSGPSVVQLHQNPFPKQVDGVSQLGMPSFHI